MPNKKLLAFPYLPLAYFFLTLFICCYQLIIYGMGTRRIVGLGIIVVAFHLWIIARIQLGSAFTLAPKATFLVTTGLYSKFRHPIYVFSIVALIGIAIFFNNLTLWVLVAALMVLELLRIKKEEIILAEKFGQKYQE